MQIALTHPSAWDYAQINKREISMQTEVYKIMKKRVLFIGLALTFAMTIIMPTAVTAKGLEDFHADGKVVAIDEGNVVAAGQSGRWIVKDRHLYGYFISGDMEGTFVMTYHANIQSTTTQAGNLQGVLVAGECELNVTGTASPAVPIDNETGLPVLSPDVYIDGTLGVVADFLLEIDGSWAMKKESIGNGTFEADIVAQICFDQTSEDYLHIVGFKEDDSYFSLDGHWKP